MNMENFVRYVENGVRKAMNGLMLTTRAKVLRCAMTVNERLSLKNNSVA